MFDGLLSPIHCITTQPPNMAGGASHYRLHGKKIARHTMDGDLLEVYETLSTAAREFGTTASFLSRHMGNGDNIMFGFRWAWEVLDE